MSERECVGHIVIAVVVSDKHRLRLDVAIFRPSFISSNNSSSLPFAAICDPIWPEVNAKWHVLKCFQYIYRYTVYYGDWICDRGGKW
jgi:hypothetical protein